MAVPDLVALLRRYKPERRTETLAERPAEALTEAAAGAADRVVLDTSAIIDGFGGRLPPGAAALVALAVHAHCSVCLGEIAVSLGKLHPAAVIAPAARTQALTLFARLYPKQVFTPSATIWTAAGLVAGTLARTQHFNEGGDGGEDGKGRGSKKKKRERGAKMMNDALVYLTAAAEGVPVLTANRKDFDLIQQVVGRGAFIYYEPLAGTAEAGAAAAAPTGAD